MSGRSIRCRISPLLHLGRRSGLTGCGAGAAMWRAALIAVVLALVGSHPAAAATVGVRDVAIPVPERHSVLHAFVWYPTGAGGIEVLVGGNAVFRGTPGLRDAPVLDGRFPLIVIAHGGFRAAPDVASWLASALASHGFITAVVNPPVIPGGPAKPSVPSELWLRPADLSAAITAVEAEPKFAKRIDSRKIGGVGFLLGGYAVLALAGARIDAEAYAHTCDGSAAGLDCAWFAKGGVNLHLVDAARLGRSNRDPRLKVAIVVDPELSGALTSQSLGEIPIPVRIVNLGSPEAIPSALDASKLASEIPSARYLVIPDAMPFSSFAECTLKGPAILKSEGGEVQLCDDGRGLSRAAIHAQVASMVVNILRRAFSPH